ncbi:MAG: hypothetical protein R6X18_10800, partial [Chloroflexota bacterium]
HEFSREDADVLANGLEAIFPGQGTAIFDRIFYWTNGHPYLTQKLCLAASEDARCVESLEQIDSLVNELFLSEASRRETNLQFIRDNILAGEPEDRRRLLLIYRGVLKGKPIEEDERSAIQNQVKLIGLVKGENGVLMVRNRIYRTVFDERWINETIPVDWNRRIAIMALIAVLAMVIGIGYYIWNSRQQTTERLIQEQQALFQSGNPSVQLTSLAALYDWGGTESIAKADEMFDTLSADERLALFDSKAAAGLEDAALTVAGALLTRLENSSENNNLLSAIAALLLTSDGSDKILLANAIDQWLSGREFSAAGHYEPALNDYNDALALLQNSPNPSLLYDIGIAYAGDDQWDQAKYYLTNTLYNSSYESGLITARLPLWEQRVVDYIVRQPPLMEAFFEEGGEPGLAALLPTLTSTPRVNETPEIRVTPRVTAGNSQAVPPTGTLRATRTRVSSALSTPTARPAMTTNVTNPPTPTNTRASPGTPTPSQTPRESPSLTSVPTYTRPPEPPPTFTRPPDPPPTFTRPPEPPPTFTRPPDPLPTFTRSP